MASFWQILPHASACITGNRVFLLDVRQDRYLLVPPSIEGTVRDWLTFGGPVTAPVSLTDLLRSAGSLRARDPEPSNLECQTVMIPQALAPSDVSPSVSIGAIARTWHLTLSTSLALRRYSLMSLLACDRGIPDIEDARVQKRIAHIYDAARSSVPVPRRCLLDSLALRRWMREAGQYPSLVFGITEVPFSAHCWLQNGTAVLNDQLDQVSRFTPILVV
ncbi:lasso peptide biosynthesis B2 protein [Sphingomonas glacialis]|uniref:Lasso peptide biosynthesis B2 protein n=1 Tax=Sphingomonas glacialis TaxID=658225 RepID=A0A502FSL3_9SPHN|nr:lasso peptide biosynthesis B2 protein [Sphingomonas glacialis]TPG52232.1 lasso peptide biosynthesis B2 protein [Sphingomonas glacialis]